MWSHWNETDYGRGTLSGEMRKVFPSLHDTDENIFILLYKKNKNKTKICSNDLTFFFVDVFFFVSPSNFFSHLEAFQKKLSNFLYFFNCDTKYSKMFTVIFSLSLNHDYVGLDGAIN